MALRYLIDSLENLPDGAGVVIPRLDASLGTLRKVVPKTQQLAPVKFSVQNGKLVVIDQKSTPRPEDITNVDVAKDELVSGGQRILDQLNQSNCDPRLVSMVKDLQDCLNSDKEIIRLGLININCEVMFEGFAEELPTAVTSMLRAHTVGVSMYVGQFPEWQRFVEQAASTHLSDSDAKQVVDAATALIKSIDQSPEIADPDVPKTLRYLISLVGDPQQALRRTTFALWRSVENLVIVVFNYGVDFFSQIASKTKDQLSTAVARTVVITLMATALVGAASLTPLASRIPESSWIGKAADIVRDHIKEAALQQP